jgi:hydroxylaminobenzene mutase
MKQSPRVAGLDAPDLKLIQIGFLLFLIGLVTGLVVPVFAVPRLGLSSHVQGILNGLFLIVLGLVWPRMAMGRALATATFVLAVYGAFANWFATLLGAMWGAGGLMPIAGAGRIAAPLGEAVVAGLLMSLSVAMIFVCLAVLWGLRTLANRG